MFCKKCGTLYNPKVGPCPKCAAEQLSGDPGEPEQMSEAEANRRRKTAWIQLIVGIPLFIGFIYLLIYLVRLIKG